MRRLWRLYRNRYGRYDRYGNPLIFMCFLAIQGMATAVKGMALTSSFAGTLAAKYCEEHFCRVAQRPPCDLAPGEIFGLNSPPDDPRLKGN